MHLVTRNINSAFREVVSSLYSGQILTVANPSRNGPVLRMADPIMITYVNPLERVLFNPARDANCFFSLYESLWMLAGRNDVAPLSYYNSKISDMASDDGVTFNGAYGHRWRHHYASTGDLYDELDQLEIIINHLRSTPDTRRAVLQMWTAYDDLLKAEKTRDTCCNLSAVFSVRGGKLDMTVFNRSNDIVLGMLGANAVHFSFLLEYVAYCVGLQVGKYHQISCDAHVYTANWRPEEWLADYEQGGTWSHEWYGSENYKTVPLVKDPATFDAELPKFVEQHARMNSPLDGDNWHEPFLQTVAKPMCWAFHCHKAREHSSALAWVDRIAADDWRVACRSWLERRAERRTRAKEGTIER